VVSNPSAQQPSVARCAVMERHSMRKIREVLRLKYERKLSHREISASVGISKGSVSSYLKRAHDVGLSWEQAQALGDAQVEHLLFKALGRNEPPGRVISDNYFCRFALTHRFCYQGAERCLI